MITTSYRINSNRRYFIMNDTIYVVKNEELLQVLNISRDKKVIIYDTNLGKLRKPEVDGFIYQCNDCGNISPISKSYKCIHRPYGKRLCKLCVKKGDRNPFYGKTHSKEMVEQMKERCREQSLNMWKNDEYREKVIRGVSKPRREGFKQEQSERISQWYKDNPEQRGLRSDHMKKSWSEGKIEHNINSINKSKGEDTLYQYLIENLSECVLNNKETIRLGRRWFFPDIIINNKVIVEYFGNYWHGNPLHYEVDDIVNHKVTAGQVWEKDKKRIDTLTEMGYTVLVVWSSDEYWVDRRLIEHIKELL